MKSADDRALLLQIVQEAYQLPTWNGTNLRASLGRVPAAAAAWRPAEGKRSIADIVVHCAYWKYAIRRQIRGDKRGSFGFAGSNWFRLPDLLTAAEWADYLGLLDEQHRELCGAIAESPRPLRYASAGSRAVVRKIFGLAIHDAYHTGQVHLLKKQWKRSKS
jgi:uncharacterized damage-inducible protein DinB